MVLVRKQTACWTDGHEFLMWDVKRLWALARELPVIELPIEEFSGLFDSRVPFGEEGMTYRELIDKMRHVQEVDLSFPIILAAEGWLLDGRTRLQKALLEGRDMVSAVRFPETPVPDEREIRDMVQQSATHGPGTAGAAPGQ